MRFAGKVALHLTFFLIAGHRAHAMGILFDRGRHDLAATPDWRYSHDDPRNLSHNDRSRRPPPKAARPDGAHPITRTQGTPQDLGGDYGKVRDQIVRHALGSQFRGCYDGRVGNRGRLKNRYNYYQGMMTVFARSLCRAESDPVKSAMARSGGPSYDALTDYGLSSPDSTASLINSYSVLLPLGMWESSGNYLQGRDMSARNTSSSTAEAGLFQTSYNIHAYVKNANNGRNARAAMTDLLTRYERNPQACMKDLFKGGKTSRTYGTGAGARFQNLMKSCPALAVEHTVIAIRYGKRHYGPLRRRQARPNPSCKNALKSMADLVKNDRQNVCAALAPPGEASPPVRGPAAQRDNR